MRTPYLIAQEEALPTTQPTYLETITNPTVFLFLVITFLVSFGIGFGLMERHNHKQRTRGGDKQDRESPEMPVEHRMIHLASQRKLAELKLTQAEIEGKISDLATKSQVGSVESKIDSNHNEVINALKAIDKRLKAWLKAN